MSPVPGWYADPSDAAQLRWWDGSTWTDDTRAHLPRTAPPPPGGSPTAPPPPPTPPPSSRPGSTGGWAGDQAGTTGAYGASGFGTGGGPAPGTGFGYGFGGASTARTDTAAAPPGSNPDRSWLSWASIGAAIAVALAVIVVLSVSLLGHKSNVPSSQGLTTPTSAGGSTTPTTAPAPSTSLAPPPPDSMPFNDPGGVYSIDVNTAWEPPPEPVGGVQLWYLTGVNYGGFRSNLNIVTQTIPAGMSLADYTQQSVQGLTRTTALHVSGTTNITLADGTPATVVSYTGSQGGDTVVGQATLTVHGTHAVVVTVLAAADAAGTTFSLVNPYVATLHLN